MPRPRVACVSFHTPGWGESTRVVEGVSVCHAAREAIRAFRSEYWHGPRPADDTWLEVSVVGMGSKSWWVTVEKALELSDSSAPLEPVKSNGPDGLAQPIKRSTAPKTSGMLCAYSLRVTPWMETGITDSRLGAIEDLLTQ